MTWTHSLVRNQSPASSCCWPRPPEVTFEYKRNLNSNLGKMVLWDTSLPSSQSAGFPNKVAILHPNDSNCSSLACSSLSSMNLDSVRWMCVCLRIIKISLSIFQTDNTALLTIVTCWTLRQSFIQRLLWEYCPRRVDLCSTSFSLSDPMGERGENTGTRNLVYWTEADDMALRHKESFLLIRVPNLII